MRRIRESLTLFVLFLVLPFAVSCSCQHDTRLTGESDAADVDATGPDGPGTDPVEPDVPVEDVPVTDAWWPDASDVRPEGFPDNCGDIGANIVVPSDFSSIQAAVDAAERGDVVCVEPGTYHENVLISGKDFELIGVAGPQLTIIDGGHAGTVIMYDEVRGRALLEGFTLRNGGPGDGGGLYLRASDVEFIDHVFFRDNAVEHKGAGAYLSGSEARFRNCAFLSNRADHIGAGIYLYGSTATIENSVFEDNAADHKGGGLGVEFSSSLVLTNAILDGNRSGHEGGGISLHESTASIANVVFVDNFAMDSGGAIAVLFSSAAVIANSILVQNEASGAAGIYVFDSTATLRYCDCWNNRGDDFGGSSLDMEVGNIFVDPVFLSASSPDPSGWDFHLGLTSPLIDAGDPWDMDPDRSRPDLGAYGGQRGNFWDLDADGYFNWYQPGPYPTGDYGLGRLDCDDRDASVFPGSGC